MASEPVEEYVSQLLHPPAIKRGMAEIAEEEHGHITRFRGYIVANYFLPEGNVVECEESGVF